MFAFILFCLFVWLVIDYKNFGTAVQSRLKKLSDRIDALEVYHQEPAEKFEEKQEVVADNTETVSYFEDNEQQEEPPVICEQIFEPEPEKFENIEKEEVKSFENIFMSNIFNKIGAVAIIISVFIFLKVLSDLGIFTPVIKILTGFLAGLGMIFASLKIHKENTKNYAEVLMGTGFAVMFITSY